MLIDKKIFTGGIVMLAVGIVIIINLNATMPAGQSGMTEEEVIDLMTRQQENKDMNTLAGILIGVGFMLILISFGARRKRKGSPEKEEKKPIT
jgi:preprotein translocase subunit SecG